MDRYERLFKIVLKYREELQKKIKNREIEMQKDNTDHYMVLCQDLVQNKMRGSAS